MVKEPMPWRLCHFLNGRPKTGSFDELDASQVIARVEIETDEPAYPVRRDFDIIYPVGRFTTVLCGPELQDAVRFNRVRAWHEICSYEFSPILRNLAERLYELRVAAEGLDDPLLASWAKYLANTLPGKLGYKRKLWQTEPFAMAPELWGEWHQEGKSGKVERWRALAGVCQREIVGGYGPDAIPSMAAWIASCARLELLRAIRQASWENVLYYDTDSLIVNEKGHENLFRLRGDERGKLGGLEERGAFDDLEIRGIKYYVEAGTVTCASVPRGLSVHSEDRRGHWWTPALGENLTPNGAGKARQVFQQWPLPGPYRHGQVAEDGTISPFTLTEEDNDRKEK